MPAAPSPLQDEDVERVEGVEVLVAGVGLDLERERAALRRARVDVVEMLEVGRYFSSPKSRGRAFRSRPPRRESGAARAKRGERGGPRERRGASPSPRERGEADRPRSCLRARTAPPAIERSRIRPPHPLPASLPRLGHSRRVPHSARTGEGSELVRHRGAPVLAAFAASYHQIVGKPEPPYRGRSFGLAEAVPARGARSMPRSIAARRSRGRAARGRAPSWRRPARRGPWRR